MNFKEYYNLQEKKEKRRLDPKCWKGYRKSGTKMKGGVRVNNCVKINENYKFSTYSELPPSPPYGFWITRGGRYIVVDRMFGHDEALKTLFPDLIKDKQGIAALESAMKYGMMRVVKMGSNYGLTYHPMYVGKDAKKTAKDIAINYNMGIVDDFEGL